MAKVFENKKIKVYLESATVTMSESRNDSKPIDLLHRIKLRVVSPIRRNASFSVKKFTIPLQRLTLDQINAAINSNRKTSSNEQKEFHVPLQRLGLDLIGQTIDSNRETSSSKQNKNQLENIDHNHNKVESTKGPLTRSKRKILGIDSDAFYDELVPQTKRRKTVNKKEMIAVEKQHIEESFDDSANKANDIPSTSSISKVVETRIDVNKQICLAPFKVGEVVWAKMRGYPCWPAKVENIYGARMHMARVYWFNDYRKSPMHIGALSKFFVNFTEFAKHKDSHIGLETAIKEALIYLAGGKN